MGIAPPRRCRLPGLDGEPGSSSTRAPSASTGSGERNRADLRKGDIDETPSSSWRQRPPSSSASARPPPSPPNRRATRSERAHLGRPAPWTVPAGDHIDTLRRDRTATPGSAATSGRSSSIRGTATLTGRHGPDPGRRERQRRPAGRDDRARRRPDARRDRDAGARRDRRRAPSGRSTRDLAALGHPAHPGLHPAVHRVRARRGRRWRSARRGLRGAPGPVGRVAHRPPAGPGARRGHRRVGRPAAPRRSS